VVPLTSIVPIEILEKKILLIRGQKVMLDRDLAELYGVETKVLLQSVKRNIKRFPADFMFQITKEEFESLRSQFVTSKEPRGGRRYMPYVFTENGVAMLSSVLKSNQAIEVNIQIMRTFTRLREMLSSNRELSKKLEDLEKKLSSHDQAITGLIHAIRELAKPEVKDKGKIGFKSV
jgi:phage regulator Rha-like protein